ncbi:hypothetical protein CEN45_16980 [Fischerella thermalis CCMEE 5198]|nr:hypothetical protein CI594_13400 [Fischerella thermalis CCMEE 5196]PMB20395.1 hypothetical protein CEN45_16980 [Fischerella thermalis CCMEE 5198]
MRVLPQRIASRRRNFMIYTSALENLPGIEFMPEANYRQATRWLTCLTINPQVILNIKNEPQRTQRTQRNRGIL